MKNICLLLLLLIFAACGSTDKIMIINKQYENTYIKGTKLGIVIPENVVSVDSAGIVERLGSGDSIKVYLNYFRSKFPNEVARFSNIEVIEFSEILNKDQMRPHELSVFAVDDFTIDLPEKGGGIILEDCNAEFILVFDDYSVSSEYDIDGSVGRSLELIHDFEFAIWDNSFGTVVSYGKMKITTYCAYPNLMSWESAVREIASSIFMGKCPFSDPI